MANPASAFPSAPPIFVDRGSGAKLLQPDNQVAYSATPTDTASLITASNAHRAALIAAGIMKPA